MAAKNKSYYTGGVKVTVGGVPCRMARKPGEFYSKAIKRNHGFDRVSLETVRSTEARYARECLETMGAAIPEEPKKEYWSHNITKELKAWDAECVRAYLNALEAAGRPQVVSEVIDESEPMLLDLKPVAAPEAVEAPVAIAQAPKLVAARKYAAETERRLISSIQSGETVCNDPIAWIAELEVAVADIEAGKCDGNFTIWQRMQVDLTGECVPFLPGGPKEPPAPIAREAA